MRLIQNQQSEHESSPTPASIAQKSPKTPQTPASQAQKSPKTPQTPVATPTPALEEKNLTKTPIVTPPSKISKKITPPTKSTDRKKRLSCGNSGCNYRTMSQLKMAEHRKLQNHLTPKKRQKTSPSQSKLPAMNCGSEGCTFSTRYQSNLARHRRRRNHYLTENDRKEADAEASRDEICREIEKKGPVGDSTEEEESNDELDVTIPLSIKYSPSKITDYFKPLVNKRVQGVKKILDLDNGADAPPCATEVQMKNNTSSSKNNENDNNLSSYKSTTVLEQ